jgi:putative membrane protein
MGMIIRLLLNALAVFLAAYFVPGIVLSGFETALIVALVLGLINIFIKPVLKIITLPINIVTLGLFGLVINAFLFWLAGYVVEGFDVLGFVPAFVGALVVAVVVWIGEGLLGLD